MGQSSANGGYSQLPAISPQQMTLLQQVLKQSQPQIQAAAEGYKQFLPGGGGGKAISDAAMKRYSQETVPTVLNAFGSDSKRSSALNQALAGSASDLNSNLASTLSQLQLQAAQGMGNLGISQQQQGLGTNSFAYAPQQTPAWQSLLTSIIGAGGKIGGAFAGRS